MNDIPEIKTLAATKTWGRGRVYDSIAETIGHTPLVRLSKITAAAKVRADILLKLEFFNPLSSVKDRIGVAMIDTLEAQGRITPGRTVLIEPQTQPTMMPTLIGTSRCTARLRSAAQAPRKNGVAANATAGTVTSIAAQRKKRTSAAPMLANMPA